MGLVLLLGFLLLQEPVQPPTELPRSEEAQILSSEHPLLSGRVRFIHWPGDGARAARLLAAIERVPVLPGLPPEVPGVADIYLAPSMEIWDALTGGAIPEWGAGVAIPSRGIAVIPVNEGPTATLDDRDATAVHEWAHLGLHDYLAGLRIPRWFDEGYAQWVSSGWDFEEAWRLRVAHAGSGAPPLDSLTLNWPADRTDAQLAYLLSASAVEYLVAESGARGMEIFLTRWREMGDFEAAFRETFGTTTGSFESRWIAHVKRRYSWVLVLYQTAAFWLFAGLAIIYLFSVRRRRDRERMAKLRATDPPDLPAYWEGPPTPPIGGFTSDREGAGRG
ncbi:MAG: hypothetical protein WD056_01245 [Gemmatimonadota bacterium]